ncbi:MAG: hypothetical protein DHS20C18_23330 [Saprospiraceae bacterium]|nr:MAG: hypothetical protein DHS20C18_23330 [Saprospiraceae bacterium]
MLLCWKIRAGFSKGIAPERIKKYTDWFFENHIKPHFQLEEAYVFPVLGANHKMVKKALTQHRRLTNLFNEDTEIERSLSRLEDNLARHIRFEERILFNEIQQVATKEQFALIEEKHVALKFEENTEDEFWK